MGELGLFYRLSPVICVGGSFVPVGGHNLIEPAQLAAVIIFGPYMHNFTEMTREFLARKAAIQLQSENEIAFTVGQMLTAPEIRVRYACEARALADEKRHVLVKILEALEPLLKPLSQKKVAT
jgi:3-deoxy-D-manno-octulosonic-acid transferase